MSTARPGRVIENLAMLRYRKARLRIRIVVCVLCAQEQLLYRSFLRNERDDVGLSESDFV